MNFVIQKIGREDEDESDEIVDNFSYEFFEDETTNLDKNNDLNNFPEKKIEEKNEIIKNKNIKIKDNNYDMVIDFDEENIERKNSNKNNYSLDQEDIIEILNLNKDHNNNLIFNEENNIEKSILDKLNAKILLKDLHEKKSQVKNAYAEYSSKLKETMDNDYIKDLMSCSDKKKSKNKINIHQQTNTINDINIFCLNNKDNNNNFINFNKQKIRKNKSELNIQNNNKPKINIINFEYNNKPDNIIKLKEFLDEFNNSLLNRTYRNMEKNPKLNYETYIDILNDLNYLEIRVSPQVYFLNNSVYKNLWNFLITIGRKNDIDNKNKDNLEVDSNSLLIFLLILNGFFNSVKKLISIKKELSWLELENYEILIINDKYIGQNFGELKIIRERNKSNLIKDSSEINKYKENNNIMNLPENIMKSVGISNGEDDIISNYFNSYAFNTNEITNYMQNLPSKKIKEKRNCSESRLNKAKDMINKEEIKNKQLYAFKPKIKNITVNMARTSLKKGKSSSKIKRVNKFASNSSMNLIDPSKNLNKSGGKTLIKPKINYIGFVNLSQNNEINRSNNQLNKRNDNSKLKTRNYYNKIKQNRTDLLKLFKNNKYKEGTINEKYEEIKRQRQGNSKSKGKIKINYENVININKIDKDKNNEENQKHKFHFKKKNLINNDK